MIKIRTYVHTSRETLFELGIKNGLSEKAANYLSYFNEVELELDINENTGEVLNWNKVNPKIFIGLPHD